MQGQLTEPWPADFIGFCAGKFYQNFNEDCTGDMDFEIKNAPGGGKVYKVSYYRIDDDE